MKFSILLPTRNRVRYLELAIQTVLRQDYGDWEIIVSDNDSEEDVAGLCRSLADERIKYHRTAEFVPVTENWNNALSHSTGDYVIMLGDDDALMRGHLSTMARLIGEYDAPDLIYTGAYIYAYPGVLPDHPDGLLRRNSNPLFRSEEPFWLSPAQGRALVDQAMKLRMPVTFNMQHSIISRRFIASLAEHGPFFQSPYPDFYATNVAFLTAKRLLVFQRPMVTIGITPRSYGFFHFNKDEKAGMEFLRNAPDAKSAARLAHVILPGNTNNTSWLLAMVSLEANFGRQTGVRVDFRRYRLLQLIHAYKNYYLDRRLSADEFGEVTQRMHFAERLLYGAPMRVLFSALRLIPTRAQVWIADRVRVVSGQYSGLGESEDRGSLRTVLDVFEKIDPAADSRADRAA
jgi:glycosyltransferase involved in cell wall biosynthesis